MVKALSLDLRFSVKQRNKISTDLKGFECGSKLFFFAVSNCDIIGSKKAFLIFQINRETPKNLNLVKFSIRKENIIPER